MSMIHEDAEPRVERPERTATARSVLMCRPEHFTVVYRINPWMDPQLPTDTSLAVRQWDALERKTHNQAALKVLKVRRAMAAEP